MRKLVERIKQNNTKLAVFNAVRQCGRATPSEVESRVESSKPTILKYLDELTEEGLIIEQGQAKPSTGRPSKLFSINSSAAFAVGVDFGAPALTFALIDLAKNIIDRKRIPTKLGERPLNVAKQMVKGIRELAHANKVSLEQQILGIGIGVPCWIDHHSELILPVPRLPHWESVPLKAIISCQIDLPLYIRSGARLMTIGEKTFGGEADSFRLISDNMLYIHIGQGLDMGVFVDGILLRGARWGVSKLGHTIVSPDGPECLCGRRGCLEAFVSEPAMLKDARMLMRQELTAHELFTAVREGDAIAQKVVGEALNYLAIAIVNVAELLDPELIVLGGNIVFVGDFVIQHLRKRLEELEFNLTNRGIKLRLSKLGLYAGALGAANLALEKGCGRFRHRFERIRWYPNEGGSK